MSKSKSRSTEAREKMLERGFDPLEEAMDIAQGKSLNYEHPWLNTFSVQSMAFQQKLNNLANRFITHDLEEHELTSLADELEEFRTIGIEQLSTGFVPPELRSKHILDLLRYRYPRLKDVEVSGDLALSAIPELKLILNDNSK